MDKTEPYFDQNKTTKSGLKHMKIIKTQNETMRKIQESRTKIRNIIQKFAYKTTVKFFTKIYWNMSKSSI